MGKLGMESKELRESRKESIKKAHIPESIRRSYKTSIKSGKLIISRKDKS
jgi:hypothetical protein